MSGVRYVPSRQTMSTRVGGEIVLIHLGTDKIYVLNRTGARVWELLAAACDRSEIEVRLLREFDVPPDALCTELDALLTSLMDSELLRPAP